MDDYYKRDSRAKSLDWIKLPKNNCTFAFHGDSMKHVIYVMTVLYHEPKLNADDMRDLASELQLFVDSGYRD